MRLTRKEAIIITIQTDSDALRVWSGLFHFSTDPTCDLDYLKGSRGGYVSAIAVARTGDEFIKRVMAELRARKLTGDEVDHLENLTKKVQDRDLSDEWLALSQQAIESDQVAFTEFDLHDNE
jgi:hypothetical protein